MGNRIRMEHGTKLTTLARLSAELHELTTKLEGLSGDESEALGGMIAANRDLIRACGSILRGPSGTGSHEWAG